MTLRFVAAMERSALEEGIDLINFERGARKERPRPALSEGVLGKRGRAVHRQSPGKGKDRAHPAPPRPANEAHYPWLESSTAMVNRYYF